MIPEWFDALEADIDTRLRKFVDADQLIDDMEQRLRHQLADAEHRQHDAERRLDPHRPALDAARERVGAAKQQVWSSNSALNRAGRLKRRAAHRAARTAHDALDVARAQLAEIEELARPATDAIAEAGAEIRRFEDRIRNIPLRRNLALGSTDIHHLGDVAQALTTWRRWADGHSVRPSEVQATIESLGDTRHLNAHEAQAIIDPIADWASQRGLDVDRSPELRSVIELDLEL
jgi:multidrug resistance efflux pump